MAGIDIAFGILCVFNMVEHMIGSYLLFKRRKEFLLLLLFSITNLAYVLINFGFFIIIITRTPTDVYVIYATLFRIPFYWLMMMLTFERFLVVFLHLRYNNSLFEQYKFFLAMLSYIVYIIMTTITVVLYKVYDYGNFYNNLTNSRYQLLGHLIVIVIFVSCYGYIYVKIRSLRFSNNATYQNRKWKIFVPFFIILSFLIFRGITELVTVFYIKKLSMYIIFIYNLDFTCNGLCYVFMQPVLRNDFLRIFTRRRNTSKFSSIVFNFKLNCFVVEILMGLNSWLLRAFFPISLIGM